MTLFRTIALGLLLFSSSLQAESFTAAKVLQSGINSSASSCLDLDVEGVCVHFYLGWSWSCLCMKVKTKTVPLVSHNLPDLVVTAFREPGETPFAEIRNTYSVPAKRAVGLLLGQSSSGGSSPLTTSENLIFNEVNVIGSPASAQVKRILERISPIGFLCDTNVTPYKPYFMSEYDAIAWRHAELNIRAESLIPGRREIGVNMLKTWGSVHPRIGFVKQNQPPKAAAVVAQRAIDIVSKRNQIPHIYSSFPISGNPETRASWQMIEPTASRGCEKFGADGEWAKGKQTVDGDFAWNYWSRHECCGDKPRFTFATTKIRR